MGFARGDCTLGGLEHERLRNVPVVRCVNFTIVGEQELDGGGLVRCDVSEVETCGGVENELVDGCADRDVEPAAFNAWKKMVIDEMRGEETIENKIDEANDEDARLCKIWGEILEKI